MGRSYFAGSLIRVRWIWLLLKKEMNIWGGLMMWISKFQFQMRVITRIVINIAMRLILPEIVKIISFGIILRFLVLLSMVRKVMRFKLTNCINWQKLKLLKLGLKSKRKYLWRIKAIASISMLWGLAIIIGAILLKLAWLRKMSFWLIVENGSWGLAGLLSIPKLVTSLVYL